MKWLLLLIVAAGATLALAILVARLVEAGQTQLQSLRRYAWAVATTLFLIAGVYAAHAIGLFSVPLVALAFVVVGIPARAYLGSSRRKREQRERREAMLPSRLDPRRAPGLSGFLARHQIVVLAVLASGAVVAAAVVATMVGPH